MRVQPVLIAVAMLLLSDSCTYNNSDVTPNVCANSTLALKITKTTNASSCSAADGSITVSASGGAKPYQFRANDKTYQLDSAFSQLTTGNYTITLKDSLGCIVSQIASVNNEQSGVHLSVTTTANTGCPTANGTLAITATGGTPPYQYKINTGSYQSANSFSSLAAGTYSVSVIDASDCPVLTTATIARSGPGFSADIASIISTKCSISGCHNGSRSPNLSSYSGISGNASSIKSVITSKSMPPSNSSGGSLSQTQINLITCWVNDGALNN